MMQPIWPSDGLPDAADATVVSDGSARDAAEGRPDVSVLAVGLGRRPAPGARASRERCARPRRRRPGARAVGRPAAGAWHHEPRPEPRLPVERVDRADQLREGGHRPHARGAPHVPSRRAPPARTASRPARTTPRSWGPTSPRSGPSTPRIPGRNAWYDAFRLPLRKMVERLSVRTAVSAEAKRNVEATSAGRARSSRTASTWRRSHRPNRGRRRRPAIVFVGPPRATQGARACCSRRSRSSIAMPSSGSRAAGPRPRRCARPRRPRSVVWLGRVSEAEKARRLRGATLACFPSIEGESFGVVLLEAMAAGHPGGRVRPHRVPPRGPRR